MAKDLEDLKCSRAILVLGPRQVVGALEYLTCRFGTRDVYEDVNCIGWNFLKIEYFFGYGLMAQFISPDWEYAIYE